MFLFNGDTIPFMVDAVALIIRMPNHGKIVSVDGGLLQKENVNYIKAEFREIVGQEVMVTTFIRHFIHFLFSNLLFSSPNYKISVKLLGYANDLNIFGEHNWDAALYNFLVAKLNRFSLK